jgi:hypothetical protein
LKVIVIFVIFCIGCAATGIALRAWYAPEWMSPDTTQNPPALRPWAVEADCYSQLARVQRILDGQGLLQNHFSVENWPEGLTPSTTAPFDYAILVLYFPLWLITKHPLDWAGALVSPALWLALVGFWMLIRSREFNLLGRALLIAGTSALPALIWATAVGRPRHQSLILVLIAMGLTAEYERWQLELAPKRAWNIFAGLAWGLACWTSLFEPAVVVTSLIVFNLIARRRENPAFLAAFGLVLLAMTLLEGGHIFGNIYQVYDLSPEYRGYSVNWLRNIAEVFPLGFQGTVSVLTPVALITPVLAWCLWPRGPENKTDAFLILLTVLLTFLASVQGRWSYYASLAGLFLVVRFCQALRAPRGKTLTAAGIGGRLLLVLLALPFLYWCLLLGALPGSIDLLLIVLTLALIGLALLPNEWTAYLSFGHSPQAEGSGQITPNHGMRLLVVLILAVGAVQGDYLQLSRHSGAPPNQPSLELAQISRAIDQPGGIMAPWWLSPGLLYFSGHPIVSGSSHCGISGIVDSAKFFATSSWADAERILDRRQVRWVVVWDAPEYQFPMLNKCLDILGQPEVTDAQPGDAENTVAQLLIEDQYLPTSLRLRAVVNNFKLYEYTPNAP